MCALHLPPVVAALLGAVGASFDCRMRVAPFGARRRLLCLGAGRSFGAAVEQVDVDNLSRAVTSQSTTTRRARLAPPFHLRSPRLAVFADTPPGRVISWARLTARFQQFWQMEGFGPPPFSIPCSLSLPRASRQLAGFVVPETARGLVA